MTTNVGLRAFARPPRPDRTALSLLAERDIANLADAMHSDRERFKKFFHGMLDAGMSPMGVVMRSPEAA